jgi:hypothetical protein
MPHLQLHKWQSTQEKWRIHMKFLHMLADRDLKYLDLWGCDKKNLPHLQ